MSSCFLRVIAVRLTSCPSLYWVIVEDDEVALVLLFWTSVEKRATLFMMLLNMNYEILINRISMHEKVCKKLVINLYLTGKIMYYQFFRKILG